MKVVKIKIDQNGGEYYGFAAIKGIADESPVRKEGKTLRIGEMEIEFDEVFEIIEIK